LTLRGFAEHLSQQLLAVDSVALLGKFHQLLTVRSVALLGKGRTHPDVRVAQRAHNTVSVEGGGVADKTHNVAIECERHIKGLTTR